MEGAALPPVSRFVVTLRRVLVGSGNVGGTVIVVVFSVSSVSVESSLLEFVVIGVSSSSRVGFSVAVVVAVEASSIGVAVVCVGLIGVPFPVLNSVVLATVFLATGVATVSVSAMDGALATDASSAMGVALVADASSATGVSSVMGVSSAVMSMSFTAAERVSSCCFEKKAFCRSRSVSFPCSASTSSSSEL